MLVWQLIATVIIVALAASSTFFWVRNNQLRQSLSATERATHPWKHSPSVAALWSGFFDSNRDTDIVLGDNSFLLIEKISKKATSFYSYLNRSYINQSHNKDLSPDARYIQNLIASKNLGNTSEFKLAQRILAMYPMGRNIHLYPARQYMPTLVKQDNVVLIGGRISNPWVDLFESQLNSTEITKFEGLGVTTVINRAPAAGEQQSYPSTDTAGYCVVAYLPNPEHTGKVLLIEGTSSEATEAAGDFLLSEDQFSTFRNLVRATPLPYFEVLLKTSQVSGTPLTVTIETYRTYPNLR